MATKTSASKLSVLKTYKMFIDGQFPRTESGRYYPLYNKKNQLVANVCLGSRKDIRNAVQAARKAQPSWNGKTAYLRSQIIYRMAEIMQERADQFIQELLLMGFTSEKAQQEFNLSIDHLVYYAGWADKYQALFSSVNPVASAHFNFSVPEPMGVITVVCPESSPLLGLIDTIIPAVIGGNAVVSLSPEQFPLSSITFSEVIATSDVPTGVINIITGSRQELLDHMANHMDVNAVIYADKKPKEWTRLRELSVDNVKRAVDYSTHIKQVSPYAILDLQEIKTTWHPVELIAAGGAKY